MINGNIDGVKKSFLKTLEELYDIKTEKTILLDEKIIEVIAKVTGEINREISVAVNRQGKVLDISIGDNVSANLPIIDIKERKLSGVRIIHTHPSGNSQLSTVDMSALLKLKLDSIIAVGVRDKKTWEISIGFCNVENNDLTVEIMGPLTLDKALSFNILNKIIFNEKNIKDNKILKENEEKETAILVGIDDMESLYELRELSMACEVETVHIELQKRDKIDSAFFIGKGKVQELRLIRQIKNANVVIFDEELSGVQVKNLENAFGCKVIDRTTLILEIFARRAKSRESKIQVELAQLKYRSARLIGLGTIMSRTGAGIGTKGPGEKKLEIDRRRIRDNIHDLKMELEKIRKNREVQREKRIKNKTPIVSLVGYTNAGKSTLRNTLAQMYPAKEGIKKENVFEADMLFATLDVTTRAIELTDKRIVTLTDTVGFVKKLPHDLIEAFKSTLEEVVYSDLLLHIIDVSSSNIYREIDTTKEVLLELNALDKNYIYVLNKIDKVDTKTLEDIKKNLGDVKIIEISAKDKINLDELIKAVSDSLPLTQKTVTMLIPYSDNSFVNYLHKNAIINSEEFLNEGAKIEAIVDDEVYNRVNRFITKQ